VEDGRKLKKKQKICRNPLGEERVDSTPENLTGRVLLEIDRKEDMNRKSAVDNYVPGGLSSPKRLRGSKRRENPYQLICDVVLLSEACVRSI